MESIIDSHTRAVLRKISKHYDIPLKELLELLYKRQEKEVSTKKDTQKQTQTDASRQYKGQVLEFVTCAHTEYLLDSKTRNLFTITTPHLCIAHLTDEHEVMLFMSLPGGDSPMPSAKALASQSP